MAMPDLATPEKKPLLLVSGVAALLVVIIAFVLPRAMVGTMSSAQRMLAAAAANDPDLHIYAYYQGTNTENFLSAPSGSVLGINWNATNVQSGTCAVYGPAPLPLDYHSSNLFNGSGSGSVPPPGQYTKITSASTFTLDCIKTSGLHGTSQIVVSTVVAPPPPPPAASADLKANGSDGPVTINVNDYVDYSWSSQGVSSCNLSWTGPTQGSGPWSMNGAQHIGPYTADIAGTYTIVFTCNKTGGGTVSDSLTLIVGHPPAPPPPTSPILHLTQPQRSMSQAPLLATLSITDEGGTFIVPYIQSSSTVQVAASADPGLISAGGGIKFVLDQAAPSPQIQYDMNAPYAAAFSGVSKGTHTLDAYVVDSAHNVQSGSNSHDSAAGIGVGDIIMAIGDSLTEGYYGYDYGPNAIGNWLNAPAGSASADGRNYPQYGPTSHTYKQSFLTDLNNKLTAYFGYPIFIMNEGWGGQSSGSYANGVMQNADWRAREQVLQPTKWIIHLGANDAYGSIPASTFQSNMQSMINTLEASYGAAPQNIYLAKPSYGSAPFDYSANYLPIIDSLVANNHLSRGADFWGYFSQHLDLYGGDPIHPLPAGFVQMARLWMIAMIKPKNVQISQSSGTVTVQWDSLAGVEPSIVGYKVRYGTAPGSYTTTLNAGAATSLNISTLNGSTTYYLAVSGYDGEANQNETALSNEVSILYAGQGTSSPPVTTQYPPLGTSPGSTWRLVSSGDFNGDGKSDLLWQPPAANGIVSPVVWFMNGITHSSTATVASSAGTVWTIVGSGDFNGDGKPDILWQGSDGTPAMWLMNGTNIAGGSSFGPSNPGPVWRLLGSGDFNQDGKTDVLWQHSNGTPATWFMDGLNFLGGTSVGPSNPGPAWRLVGAGDFNQDGKPDLLWQNTDGMATVWLMNGTTFIAGAYITPATTGTPWRLVGTGDFNGDGKSDLLWQSSDGTPAVWLMNGTAFSQ